MIKKVFLFTVLGLIVHPGHLMSAESQKTIQGQKELEKLNIIPTPKMIKIHDGKLVLTGKKIVIVIPENSGGKIRVAVGLIVDKIKKEAKSEPVICSTGELSEDSVDRILIRLIKKTDPALRKYPLGAQGYHIAFPQDNTIEITAQAPMGIIYGAVSLTQMISKDHLGNIMVSKTEIIDWPDFKKRCGNGQRVWNVNQGKDIIDWFLKFKYNCVVLENKMQNTPDSLVKVLKEVNEYARQRGIETMYIWSSEIGNKADDGNNPEFKGCLTFKNRFFCWSRDKLIRKKAAQYAKFIMAIKPSIVNFHALDSALGNWPERCDKCRDRFGDDRTSADLNVINIFINTIRKKCPDVKLGFVTQPYGIDINLPGNEQFFEYYRQLSRQLPEDVYLNHTGYNHDSQAAMNQAVKQPIIRWQNGSAFQAGRFFTNEPRLFKGVYFPARKNDIAFLSEPYGKFRDGEVMLLEGIEYMWNTDAPGSGIMRTDKSSRITSYGPYMHRDSEIDGKKVSYHKGDGSGIRSDKYDLILGVPEVSGTLLKRICMKLYGQNLATYMHDFLRLGVIGWWSPQRVLRVFGDEPWSAEQEYRKCIKAQDIMVKAIAAADSPAAKSTAERFLKRMIPLTEFYGLLAFLQKIESAINTGKYTPDMLAKFKEQVSKAEKRILAGGISKKNVNTWLDYPLKQLQVVAGEAQIRAQLQMRKNRRGFKVAIYYPELRKGKSAGAKTIFGILGKHQGIVPAFIDNLQEKELKNYKVIIIPHVTRFALGDEKLYRKNIREYVENGGGAYFEHDSVGFFRGARLMRNREKPNIQ